MAVSLDVFIVYTDDYTERLINSHRIQDGHRYEFQLGRESEPFSLYPNENMSRKHGTLVINHDGSVVYRDTSRNGSCYDGDDIRGRKVRMERGKPLIIPGGKVISEDQREERTLFKITVKDSLF